jgi:hypothetical protein
LTPVPCFSKAPQKAPLSAQNFNSIKKESRSSTSGAAHSLLTALVPYQPDAPTYTQQCPTKDRPHRPPKSPTSPPPNSPTSTPLSPFPKRPSARMAAHQRNSGP